MNFSYIIITSISSADNLVLRQIATESAIHGMKFILIGDTKSPVGFNLDNCDFYSIDRQIKAGFSLAPLLPEKHYSRKNIGYLTAISNHCECLVETDDDNFPYKQFWEKRQLDSEAHIIENAGWVNVYRYFSENNIWPRGFALSKIHQSPPPLEALQLATCPIQQGLADLNPDVDAIYRLVLPLPVNFHQHEAIAVGRNSWCPFNSQNTTWFRAAFPLLYLPSFCSFRMTDIWRSFIAQRISWTCDWKILFHNPTVYQQRNEHNLMLDFDDEIPGFLNNEKICNILQNIDLDHGYKNIFDNLIKCYSVLIQNGFLDNKEMVLLDKWVKDCSAYF